MPMLGRDHLQGGRRRRQQHEQWITVTECIVIILILILISLWFPNASILSRLRPGETTSSSAPYNPYLFVCCLFRLRCSVITPEGH